MSAVPFTLALAGGFLTILSPCILPILPILLGTSLRSHRLGPVALVAGLIGGFALAGSLLGITVSWFAGAASILRNVAILVLFAMGSWHSFQVWATVSLAALVSVAIPRKRQDYGENFGSVVNLVWSGHLVLARY